MMHPKESGDKRIFIVTCRFLKADSADALSASLLAKFTDEVSHLNY